MVGTAVEREGIIRHGAKLISAVSEATVPKISVVVRKAYGAGLYAMSGPGFGTDATIALPTAKIAVMGPQAAVNAVYANKIEAITDLDERAAYVAERRAEYEADVDLLRLASDLVLDAIIEPSELRAELIRRYAVLVGKPREVATKRHGIPPT
jgi:acetyl-CoA carboxylase carboxyltransferase component